MFTLLMDEGPRLKVSSRHHQFDYAVDGSLPNPLEAAYAALTGCAGVYARKACLALGVSPAGIEVRSKPTARSDNPMLPSKITTQLLFPAHFDAAMRQSVLEAVLACPVKNMIAQGHDIDFQFEMGDVQAAT